MEQNGEGKTSEKIKKMWEKNAFPLSTKKNEGKKKQKVFKWFFILRENIKAKENFTF